MQELRNDQNSITLCHFFRSCIESEIRNSISSFPWQIVCPKQSFISIRGMRFSRFRAAPGSVCRNGTCRTHLMWYFGDFWENNYVVKVERGEMSFPCCHFDVHKVVNVAGVHLCSNCKRKISKVHDEKSMRVCFDRYCLGQLVNIWNWGVGPRTLEHSQVCQYSPLPLGVGMNT